MKIAIITNESFPSGMATTNRIHSLAKGLILYGDFVEVLCVRPTEEKENPLNFNKVGETEEIKFFDLKTDLLVLNRLLVKKEKKDEPGTNSIIPDYRLH